MEYCEHGDLKKYLAEHGRLPEDQAQEIGWQVLQGLKFMHENRFAHRDLKPAVSFLNKEQTTKSNKCAEHSYQEQTHGRMAC